MFILFSIDYLVLPTLPPEEECRSMLLLRRGLTPLTTVEHRLQLTSSLQLVSWFLSFYCYCESLGFVQSVTVCVCVCACVRACVRACTYLVV